MSVKFSKQSKWSEISFRFCRYHRLPHGSAIKIVYMHNPKYPAGRVQRDNTVYSREVFRRTRMPRADPEITVRQLIDIHLLPHIDIDPADMGAEIVAFFPDGSQIKSPGKTLVRTWQKKDAQPTPDEILAEEERLEEVDEVANLAGSEISNLSEFRWNPEDTIPQGVIRALVRAFGPDAVKRAILAEVGGK